MNARAAGRVPANVDTVAGREASRSDRERAITGNRQASWTFAEGYVDEVDALAIARSRARAAGIRAVSPGTGAALRLLAASIGAKAVAEIGTGYGVSGIHLLHGMRHDGVLTTVDTEPDRQQLAKQAFRASGFAANRARFIPGAALEVLPRLTDGGYDLVFCDGDRTQYPDYFAESLRLLRPGGLLCLEGVFAEGRALDLGHQGPDLKALREVVRLVKESDQLTPALLPTGDGLLCGVKKRR
jgi:predicted O-methyltransferase YrrM